MFLSHVTSERLKEILDYEAETGKLIWKVTRNQFVHKGDTAGSVRKDGYLDVCFDGKHYLAHRLIWCYFHGSWSKKYIDHIDGDRLNNRITNLREVSKSQNGFNRPKTKANSSGHKGVSIITKKKTNKPFVASSTLNGKHIWLGQYATIEEAIEAYRVFVEQNHGEYANLG